MKTEMNCKKIINAGILIAKEVYTDIKKTTFVVHSVTLCRLRIVNGEARAFEYLSVSLAEIAKGFPQFP